MRPSLCDLFRRVFVGGGPELQDLSYVSHPTDFSCKVCSFFFDGTQQRQGVKQTSIPHVFVWLSPPSSQCCAGKCLLPITLSLSQQHEVRAAPAAPRPTGVTVDLASLSQATATVMAAFRKAHERMERASKTATLLFGDKMKLS